MAERSVVLCAVQPPMPEPEWGVDTAGMQARAFELLEEAGRSGAQVACLPEYFNVYGMALEEAVDKADEMAERVVGRCREIAARWRMWMAVPVVLHEGQRLVNRAVLIGPDGKTAGHYDKTHLAPVERQKWAMAAGSDIPVFQAEWGRFGVMICYDIVFPEVARVLALRGAEVVLFPSLQRSCTQRELELQLMARAYDNALWIVRSSYGTLPGRLWEPGRMVGLSCIVAPDGQIVASCGRWVGVALWRAQLDPPIIGRAGRGGPVRTLRELRMADRRPELYGELGRSQ